MRDDCTEAVELVGGHCRTRADAGGLECAHYPSMAEARSDIFIQVLLSCVVSVTSSA